MFRLESQYLCICIRKYTIELSNTLKGEKVPNQKKSNLSNGFNSKLKFKRVY